MNAAERIERIKREGLKPDGKWNRRVVRHPCGSLAIHEVYYDIEGNIVSWAVEGADAVHPEDGLEGLIESVEFSYESALEAIARPILDAGDLPGIRAAN